MFRLPNDVFGGTIKQKTQATPFDTDFDILAAGYKLTGVASGCAVTAQVSPNMTVAVASGRVLVTGALATVAGGNVTITANSSGQPRLDLIVVSAAGTVTAVAGTPAAAPALPALPASSVALAAVYVDTGATAITTNELVDKRVELPPSDVYGFIDRISLGAGDLTVGVYQERMRSFSGSIELLGVSVSCGFTHGPVGGNTVFDLILETATSLWAITPANRPTILNGATAVAAEVVPETTLILPTQSLRPSVVSVAPTPGSYGVMNVRWRWA